MERTVEDPWKWEEYEGPDDDPKLRHADIDPHDLTKDYW